MPETVSTVVWNVEWAGSRSTRGRIIRDQIWELDPDIVCICEGIGDWTREGGYWLLPSTKYGPKAKADHHKVMLWSKKPWLEADTMGSDKLPAGRFIQAATQTPIGRLDIFGVCIPYHMSNVSFGTRDKKPWEDHKAYLTELRVILDQRQRSAETIVMGDYNQRIPRTSAPDSAFNALHQTFSDEFTIVTPGVLDGLSKQGVDHLAITKNLSTTKVWGLSEYDPSGRRLSDHPGVAAEFLI